MRNFVLLVGLATLAAASPAQDARLSEGCDVTIFGGWDTVGFLAFDQELRSALRDRNIAALSLLVRFPLRVNAEGTFSIDSPTALQSRFDEIFPPTVRASVLEQKQKDFSCNWSGLHYGGGDVWVGVVGHRYAVTTVNRPRQSIEQGIEPGIAFACDAERHRFVIEMAGKQEVRLLGWTKPRSLREEPDIVVSGKVDYAGTGLCAHPIWTFESGDVTYTLSGMGCTSETDPPPDGAKGSISHTGPNDRRQFSWCY